MRQGQDLIQRATGSQRVSSVQRQRKKQARGVVSPRVPEGPTWRQKGPMTTTGRVARLMAAPSPRLRRLVFRTTTSCPAKPRMRFASHLCCTARVGPGTLPGHTAEPALCCSLGAGPGASRLKSLPVTLLGSWGRKPRSSSASGGAGRVRPILPVAHPQAIQLLWSDPSFLTCEGGDGQPSRESCRL